MKEACKKIIVEAGKRLLEVNSLKVEEKTDFKNLVTQYDVATEEFLISSFKEIAPDADFLGEEGEKKEISMEKLFVIDPIDGTANFVHGLGMSAVSVAYTEKGEVIWGIVYNPFTDELFEAEKGKGAFLNGREIHVSLNDLKHSIVAVGTSPYNRDYHPKTFKLAFEIMEHCMDIRRSGSAALDLCYVAAGRYGLYFEQQLAPWDFAAGMLILQEAGGTVTNYENRLPDFTKQTSIVAGNNKAEFEFREVFDESLCQ